jgi:predicted outer membrane lipoprotein
MFWRHLVGVAAAQAATGLVVWLAFAGPDPAGWALAGPVALAVGLITAMWLSGLSAAERRTERARADLRVAEARETVRVEAERARADQIRAAERQRANDLRDAERRVAKAARTRGLPIKLGLTAGAVAGVGVALMAAQFLTLGLAAVAVAGGAAVGWRLRAPRAAAPPMLDVTPAPKPRGVLAALRRRDASQAAARPD